MQTAHERRAVTWALVLNATMFVVGALAGWIAHSSGLLADALDMLSDSFAYAIALIAIGRTGDFKRKAASATGIVLVVLGALVLVDTLRRAFGADEPLGWIMIAAATVSLIVNVTVLRLLAPFQEGEVHLRASWICTRADVVANIGVIVAAGLVLLLNSNIPDVVIGLAIGSYVIKEAFKILAEARESGPQDVERIA
jgi:Co/Zn/Cd efflux system component